MPPRKRKASTSKSVVDTAPSDAETNPSDLEDDDLNSIDKSVSKVSKTESSLEMVVEEANPEPEVTSTQLVSAKPTTLVTAHRSKAERRALMMGRTLEGELLAKPEYVPKGSGTRVNLVGVVLQHRNIPEHQKFIDKKNAHTTIEASYELLVAVTSLQRTSAKGSMAIEAPPNDPMLMAVAPLYQLENSEKNSRGGFGANHKYVSVVPRVDPVAYSKIKASLKPLEENAKFPRDRSWVDKIRVGSMVDMEVEVKLARQNLKDATIDETSAYVNYEIMYDKIKVLEGAADTMELQRLQRTFEKHLLYGDSISAIASDTLIELLGGLKAVLYKTSNNNDVSLEDLISKNDTGPRADMIRSMAAREKSRSPYLAKAFRGLIKTFPESTPTERLLQATENFNDHAAHLESDTRESLFDKYNVASHFGIPLLIQSSGLARLDQILTPEADKVPNRFAEAILLQQMVSDTYLKLGFGFTLVENKQTILKAFKAGEDDVAYHVSTSELGNPHKVKTVLEVPINLDLVGHTISAASWHHVNRNAPFITSITDGAGVTMPMAIVTDNKPPVRHDADEEPKPVEVYAKKLIIAMEMMLNLIAIPVSMAYVKKALYKPDKNLWMGTKVFKLEDAKWQAPKKGGTSLNIPFTPRDGFRWEYEACPTPYVPSTLEDDGIVNITEFKSTMNDKGDNEGSPFGTFDEGDVQCYMLLSDPMVKQWLSSFRDVNEEGFTPLNETRGPTNEQGEAFLSEHFVSVENEDMMLDFLKTSLPIFYGVRQSKTSARLALM